MVNGHQENKTLSSAEQEEKRNIPKIQQKGPACYALAGPQAFAGPLDAWSGESLHLQVCQCATTAWYLNTAAESATVSSSRCPMTDCGAVRVPYVDLRDGERVRRDRTTPLSPRLALRRVLVLAEGRQFREAAAVLSRLGPTGLAVVASELPLDILVESLPHSAQLLETLFSKLVASCQRPSITADPVIWQLVRLLASYEDPTLKSKVAKLAKTLVEWQPDFRRQLMSKKKALEQAVQGLGCHGLTADASGLTHLHVALKTELQRHVDAYKSALHRLDEFSTSNSKNPTDASHHRLLSLHYSDVQQRLIDNKTLLTLIDKPALQQLRPLVETLSARVQSDKEALFCVSQLKRLQPITDDKPVASLLMSYSRGCATLLELMQNDGGGGGSPCSSDGYHSETEPETEREADVIGRYGALYMQNRPRALEALDSLPELMHATQLKAKILFSVVVLAFRSCRNLREHKVHEMCSCLHVDVRSHAGITLRNDVIKCLGSTAESFPLQEVERQVRNMVCGTLKEYTCLENCTALCRYIRDVTRVSWMLVNQTPSYELDTDFTTPTQLQPDRHVRHHSSDRNCDIVRSYLWPALMINSNFVHKAVVITGL